MLSVKCRVTDCPAQGLAYVMLCIPVRGSPWIGTCHLAVRAWLPGVGIDVGAAGSATWIERDGLTRGSSSSQDGSSCQRTL
jgi:hypothetical protein